MNNYLTALDFGSSKIAVAVGCKTEAGIRIVSYHDTPSLGIKNGEIINDFHVVQAIRSVIEQASEDIGEPITSVVVGVGAKILHSMVSTFSKERAIPSSYITATELEEFTHCRYNVKDSSGEVVLEAAPQRYSIDDYIGIDSVSTIGMTGKNIEVDFRLICGKDSILDKRRTILDKCGLTMQKAILSPIASARAVLTEPEMENGTVLVDIGKGTTEVVIIKDNVVKDVTSIPFGGESITNDIKSLTNVTAKWAEEVKISRGCCCEEFVPENTKIILKSTEGVAEGEIDYCFLTRIIEARISEILDAVRYFIDNNPSSADTVMGVVMTGGTCYLENIKQLAQAILSRKIRLAAPRGSITCDSVESSYDAYSSTAVGLVLEGVAPLLSHAMTLSAEQQQTALQQPSDNKKTQSGGNGLFGHFFGESKESDSKREEAKRAEALKKEEEKLRKEAQKKMKAEEKRRKEEEKRNEPDLFTKFFKENSNNA